MTNSIQLKSLFEQSKEVNNNKLKVAQNKLTQIHNQLHLWPNVVKVEPEQRSIQNPRKPREN